MLQPKKPIKKSNQTIGEFNALMKEYKLNLRIYELDNNPIKKKKYGYGSSNVQSPVLVNPINTIYQSQIDRAYAGSQHNDLVNGLDIFGSAAMGIGGQMMAAMGNSNAQGDVEVEGKEVIETPAGEVAEVEGASHEQGGVNMNVPEGTKIYSKRIEKFGKTMAERKMVRERKLTNLNKLLENSKGDIAVKNAHARSVEALNEQEQADLQTQEMFSAMSALQEFAFGTDENGVRKYGDGTGPGGIFGPQEEEKPKTFLKTFLNNFGDYPNILNNFGDYGNFDNIPENNTISPTNEKTLNKNNKYDKYSHQKTSIDKPENTTNKSINRAGKVVDKSGFKIPGTGDMIGMAGNLYSAFAPMDNTLENRTGDTPNVNSFKDYGQKGLATIDKSKSYIAEIKDNKLQDAELDRTGAIKRNSNSARSVNTMRALNLATDVQVNNQKDNIEDVFAQQMMSILGQEAGMKNQQDQIVMDREQERDLNDRKDRDNFYTQLGKDIATKGEGIQHIGKDLNTIKQNDMMTNVINQLSKYVAFDEKGNIIEKPKTT